MTLDGLCKHRESRLLWVLFRAPFESRRARLVGFWHYIVCRYAYEICMRCGGCVGPHTGSWWEAPDDLWAEIAGGPSGVMCPPCFSAACEAQGTPIHWLAVRGV